MMKKNLQIEKLLKKSGIQYMRNRPKFFVPTFVLGRRNGYVITVADMLEVIENTMFFIKENFNVNQEKYSETIKFLHTCKSMYKNQPSTKPRKKAMHFVVDVFHEIQDMRAANDEQKKENEEISAALDLLIDMFA